MATHSSVLPWRIPGTGEPGGLPSMGSHGVSHDWSDLAAAADISRNLVLFYVWEDASIWAHWIHSFHMHHNSLEPNPASWLSTSSVVVVVKSLNSVQFRRSVMSDSLRPHEPQYARAPCPSPTGVHPKLCPLSQWCRETISSFVVPFISCLQSFPASGCFPISQLSTSGGQSVGVTASTSVLPTNTQDWSPLGRTGWISLQSKGRWIVFSNTTFWKHQSYNTQPSSWSNSHIHTWLLEKS